MRCDGLDGYIEEETFQAPVKPRLGVYQVNLYPSQMEEDIDLLEYVLTNLYSNRDVLKRKGILVSEILKKVKEKVRARPRMNGADFFDLLCSSLDGIRDSHLVFSLPYFEKRHRFCVHKTVYFADLKLQKRDGGYVVFCSGVPHIRPGDEIAPEPQSVFPTVDGLFLYGVLDEAPIRETTCVCSGWEVRVPVFPVEETRHTGGKTLWRHERRNSIDIVTVRTLSAFSPSEEQQFEALISCAEALRPAEKIILDLRGNPGGDSEIARRFVEKLNGAACLNLNYAKLDSPGSRLAEISRYATSIGQYEQIWEALLRDPVASWKRAQPQQVGVPQYTRPLVVLADRFTSSSAEILIKCLKDNLPQTLLMGENTSGTLNTGDVRYFYLPNSGIFLNVPTALFAGILEEGTGFFPDYWCRGDAMEMAVGYLSGERSVSV